MLERDKHVKYFRRCLQCLPSRYGIYDQQRLPFLYFILSGLDSLSAIDQALPLNEQANIVDWLYNYCLHDDGGFMPSTTFNSDMTSSHVTMTYSALICLLILGDDLKGLNRALLLKNLAKFQNPQTGAIKASPTEESDLRFSYCAIAIYYMLQGDNGDVPTEFNIKLAIEFVMRCQTYEGGFAQLPGLEAHGGSTYCALACLKMTNTDIPNKHKLLRWLLFRQERVVDADHPSCGFSGRVNKIADSCYTFWVGSCLGMLGHTSLIRKDYLENFLLECQVGALGGFSKWRNEDSPDPMHSALSILGSGNFESLFSDQLQSTCPFLGTSATTLEKVRKLEFEVHVEEASTDTYEQRSLDKYHPNAKPIFSNPVFAAMKTIYQAGPRQKTVLSAIAAGLLAYIYMKLTAPGDSEQLAGL